MVEGKYVVMKVSKTRVVDFLSFFLHERHETDDF